ncbi:MAG: response regulator transcription factor [Acidobacteriaceae bacterium]|nr:response regulator transcription factor [Acidobacteriaceae bacterium]
MLADRQLLFRRGLRTLLSAESDIEVVTETSTLQETLLKSRLTSPDVVVMDVDLLQEAPHDDVVAIRHMQSATGVLFLTAADEPRRLELAMAAGARGYMLKNSAPAELVAAVLRIAKRDQLDPRSLSDTAADLQALADTNERYSHAAALTLREQEILKLLAEGRTVRQTAIELSLSIKTVEAHKLNLMRKLDIHDRATLIEYAVQRGVIDQVALAS